MNASISSTFNWTVKILGLISMLILSIVALLLLGIVFGGIEPNGSTIEQITKFLFTHPWAMVTMLILAGWATLLFWKKK